LTLPFLLSRCAKPVSPQGGPKDVTPPVVISCEPPNLTTNFKQTGFRLDFNEFVNLKNPVNEIFISPPLKKQLDTRLKGKSVIVKIEDSLAANTTYSVTFGSAIMDLTEGNVLKGFTYVFSTGRYVDTLSLQGNLQTAFDHKPQKEVFAELYINNNDTLPFDSLPVRVAPYYITKTDEQGNFMFRNLQHANFKLFALADQNGDLIFNQPAEKIAFYDSLVTPYFISPPKSDSLSLDSALVETDNLAIVKMKKNDPRRFNDSVNRSNLIKENLARYPSFNLFLFEETDSVQRLLKATSPAEGVAMLAFRFPVNDFRVVPLNFDSTTSWCLEEVSKKRDSVRLWITRPAVDSLRAKIILGGKVLDTIDLEVSRKDARQKTLKKDKPLQLGILNSAGGVGLNEFKDKLYLTFSRPLVRWDFKKVLLVMEKDTINPEIHFTDSVKRKVVVMNKWLEEKNYSIIIPDSVFFSIGNISHDSVKLSFRTKGERDFGNLVITVNIDKRPGQYIVQLINENETAIFEEHVISGSGKVHFDFMNPGKYKIKAVRDRNRNNRWDTGNYRLNIQPEEVYYYPKTVEIRANWEVEETWD
jgi:hypothetical protein